ncbi:MAG: hypothetical protein H7Y88_10325 [Phycisphaerales bacterium]|nr:hypothetical protein [Phycisphaerales bacterium]
MRTLSTLAVRRVLVGLSAVAACGLCLVGGGCYERVVGAHGPGADQYNVSDPYQESSEVDRWIFGDDAAEARTRSGGSRLPKE